MSRRSRLKRYEEDPYAELDDLYYPPEKKKAKGARFKVLNICYAAVLIAECILCGKWLIYPLMPIISGLMNNQGVPTVGYTAGSGDLLSGISVFGMKADSLGILLLQTFFRIVFFIFLFWITPKLYHLFRRLLGAKR